MVNLVHQYIDTPLLFPFLSLSVSNCSQKNQLSKLPLPNKPTQRLIPHRPLLKLPRILLH